MLRNLLFSLLQWAWVPGLVLVSPGVHAETPPVEPAAGSSSAVAQSRPPMVLSPQGLAKFYGTWTEPSSSPSAPSMIASGMTREELARQDATASSQASPAPSESPAGPVPLGKTNVPSLRNSFEKALSEERLALAHRQKMEMRELKASQRQGMREWMTREKSARVEFFEKTDSGNAKANWMKDRKLRYAKFQKEQEAELGRLRKTHESQRKELKTGQDARRKTFETAIKSGFLPARELWSTPGKG